MENNQIEEEIDPRIIGALDDVLEELSFDADQQVRVLQTCDDREVIIIQPNAFTIPRIYATGDLTVGNLKALNPITHIYVKNLTSMRGNMEAMKASVWRQKNGKCCLMNVMIVISVTFFLQASKDGLKLNKIRIRT